MVIKSDPGHLKQIFLHAKEFFFVNSIPWFVTVNYNIIFKLVVKQTTWFNKIFKKIERRVMEAVT